MSSSQWLRTVLSPKRAVLLNCLAFPRAESHSSQPVVWDIHVKDYKVEEVEAALQASPDKHMQLHARGLSKLAFLDTVGLIAGSAADGMPVGGFRFLQVSEARTGLVRIHKEGNEQFERAAFIDLADFGRELQKNRRERKELFGTIAALLAIGYCFSSLELWGRKSTPDTTS
eukprot:gnl/Hemi2/7770_TR2680_c0_g1_i1.p1 gnl/Hemi2/7770_TR2680_c0_g1~~gnl/Hemi2/7770_TR2680_c0_g1_i1.p1  ORF type:complete len:172 (+),score=21.27 gnl/Hemi2/7770_TR2680_c0_g1_i1:241-756(+)